MPIIGALLLGIIVGFALEYLWRWLPGRKTRHWFRHLFRAYWPALVLAAILVIVTIIALEDG